MKTPKSKTERIYSLDSLRAIMMLLGLVLHAAITYGAVNYERSWELKDPNAVHILNDLLVIIIHAFRMPVFFVVAGFFGALLFYERAPRTMIKNRISRILYPFIVFFILLAPLLVFGNYYTNLVFAGNETPWQTAVAYFSNSLAILPAKTYHLWFLYYLVLLTAAAVLLAFAMQKVPAVSQKMSGFFNWIFARPFVRVFFFALVTFFTYVIMGIEQVETSMSLIPDANTFVFYFTFYIVGWILYNSKHLLTSLKRFDWLNVVLGTLLLLSYIFTYNFLTFEIKITLSSLFVWFLIFGITGLFIRYASTFSARMRYISDASYWVYLFHLPLTVLIPALIADWPISGMLKFLIVLTGTAIPCFLTYHYFVRATFIGKFLNGRKYPRQISAIRAPKASVVTEKSKKQEDKTYKEPSTVSMNP